MLIEKYGSRPVGSGPYRVIQFDKGQQVIAVPNEHYYGKKPKFKKLTMVFLAPDAVFAAVKKGTVDIAKITEPLARNKVKGYRLAVVPSYDNRGIAFQTATSILSKGMVTKMETTVVFATRPIRISRELSGDVSNSSIVCVMLDEKNVEYDA